MVRLRLFLHLADFPHTPSMALFPNTNETRTGHSRCSAPSKPSCIMLRLSIQSHKALAAAIVSFPILPLLTPFLMFPLIPIRRSFQSFRFLPLITPPMLSFRVCAGTHQSLPPSSSYLKSQQISIPVCFGVY
ncbi:uncharacterized protein MYCFIDRAFT_177554 [Pseudocercospora fijiensis CIRAD86]|uniref:Uncharacterized protein n=1 Tax=Pseudocercospora fijiensis (strain CIRAD86) TaxID=383855 RepID=M2ZNF1_PSEFD|nr:uncharacterized protein MYCFIDRAFT_177554 [Pseudocercospora fijiensis CIRAD86]EME80624.1 hypothetical protein MYCFIDRAFT_177554 [Pseudocercospora fijiensis CIRAD86]